MLQSLHNNQYLLMQSFHQLSLQPPVMTPEAFLSQIAWLGVQLHSVRGGGDTFDTGNDDAAEAEADNDYITNITVAHEA